MPAYVVFTREKTLDRGELEQYWSELKPTFHGHTVRVLADYGAWEDLEGSPSEGTVIAEFPSMEAAKAWYYSPEYTRVREHRLKGAVYQGLLVEGLSTQG